MVQMFRCMKSLFLAFCVLVPLQAHAVTLIRDADIEASLKELSRPLITAAGLSPSRVKIVVVKDNSMNAFVVDGSHVFLNSGLIMRLDSAAELQSVIAHELAHIVGGHLITRRINAGTMGGASSLGFLLALATAAAGGGDAAVGLGLGVAGSARGVFLGHTRGEEASADAAAVRYMARAGIDPRAAIDVFDHFRGQEVLSAQHQDPYTRSHPLTSDRIRAVAALAASVEKFPEDKNANYWFNRTQAKLSAFLNAPSSTLRRYKANDPSSIAKLARAVAYHRTPDTSKALSNIDAAIAQRPTDAYLYDLKGQILLESRRYQAAVAAYQKADSLKSNHPQILAGLGRAYLALNTGSANRNALITLKKSYSRDSRDARMLRDLAVAYARSGENAMASLATAERYAMLGRSKDAILHAERAAGALPEGSVSWRKAKDIVQAAKRAEK